MNPMWIFTPADMLVLTQAGVYGGSYKFKQRNGRLTRRYAGREAGEID
jgi:hypothetical protein